MLAPLKKHQHPTSCTRLNNLNNPIPLKKLIEDKRFSDKIDRVAENYLNEHLERYGIVKVVKPGARGRVLMFFKRGEHRDVVFM